MSYSPRILCAYLYTISRHGYPPPAGDTLKHMDAMKALGFQSIELEGIRESHLRQIHGMRAEIAEHKVLTGLSIPFFCIVLPGLSSQDAETRKKNLRLFDMGCQTAQTLGAAGVLDNAPLPPYVFAEDIPVTRHYEPEILQHAHLPRDLHWPTYWKAMVETYREACQIAASYQLTYHMHPCAGVLANTTDGFLYFADAVGADNLRFNLDTANQFFQRDNLYLSLVRLADRIDYIHISDNHGDKVAHLPPGVGAIDWSLFFEKLTEIRFKGFLGLDIGGAESPVDDLDDTYRRAAHWLESWLATSSI